MTHTLLDIGLSENESSNEAALQAVSIRLVVSRLLLQAVKTVLRVCFPQENPDSFSGKKHATNAQLECPNSTVNI